MTKPATLRVFVSSPSDVRSERDQLDAVVQELNLTLRTLLPGSPAIELVRYETHAAPGFGDGPQDVVSQQLGDYDVFLGIMWSRFGTPTPTAGSGTEEEFRTAYRGYRERRAPSHLLFYFCEQPIPAQEAWSNADQLAKIGAFRAELQELGLLGSYPSHAAFADTVRPALTRVLSEIIRAGEQPAQIAQQAADDTSADDKVVVRRRIFALAAEYERVRLSMPSGAGRTAAMEAVSARMRADAQAAFGLLDELQTGSDGQRLAAVSVLEVIPVPALLDWLARRVEREKPFVAYHACVALLAAARSLPERDLPAVASAFDRATAATRSLLRESDRKRVLRYVDEELKHRLNR